MENTDRNSVLIVDDENSNIIALSHILRPDYTVYAAKSGQDAIKTAKKYLPDVILLDILMPQMDGYEILSVLQNDEETKGIPVIFITGLRSSEEEKKGLDLGAADYITKPFSPAIVKLRVRKLIQMLNLIETAERNSRYKTEFLARMSHEIRTPMNAIIGMTELALREDNKHAKNEYIMTVKQASSNLLAIINDILDFSKIEAGKMEIVPCEYSFMSMLNDVISIIKMRVIDSEVQFIVKVDSKIPSTLYGDVTRIRQSILNLLSNAVKYTENGFVSLSVDCEWTSSSTVNLTFEVADSGIGIKHEDIGRLFADFTQLDLEKNRGIEGVGLGLAITKNIVNAMGGDITVKSEYGKGSTFTIKLPQEIRLQEVTADNELTVRFSAPEAKILVVDDIHTNLKVAQGLLAPYDMKIDLCSSGKAAIEAVQSGDYDLVFMDHKMPGMDGIETTKQIRKWENEKNGAEYPQSGRIPVVALTANAVSGMEEMFLENGFNDILSKPIDTVKLNVILEKWIPKEKQKSMKL